MFTGPLKVAATDVVADMVSSFDDAKGEDPYSMIAARSSRGRLIVRASSGLSTRWRTQLT